MSNGNSNIPTIRVKDFAKAELFQNNNIKEENVEKEDGHSNKQIPIDIETISLSSNEDFESVPKTPVKPTPRPKQKRQPRSSTAFTPRSAKKPLNFKNHKISEYFSSAKKAECPVIPSAKLESSNNIVINNPKIEKPKPPEKTEVQKCMSNLRSVKVVLRRLSIEKTVDTTRKRKVQEDQSKLPEFIEYETEREGYFQTYDQSTLNEPKQNALTEQANGAVLLGKRTKLDFSDEFFEQNSRTKSDVIDEETSKGSLINADVDSNKSVSAIENGESKSESSSDTKSSIKTKKETKGKKVSKASKNLIKKAKTAAKRKKKVECPHYKIVEDTKLAVDAFRYGDIEGVEHYFLSHFHADHYIGLKKSFNHKLYVSKITGRLVVEFIKVEEKYIQYLDINTPTIVDDVEVTCLDANHCPGAVLFLFKLKSGKCILHTGDFRASPDMEEYPEFWNNDIDTIYLDTTYLSSKYEFPTQSESIANIITFCREFVKSSTSSSGKHLIICGAYKVGKEKVWLRIAQEFNYKVWIDNERHKAMQCIQNDEINEVLTRHAKDASIHVLPLGNISYPVIVDYLNQFGETFCKVLAIRPSGWEKSKSKLNFNNRISILGVQYSEHSSYNELERFVRFLRPKNVISTVPYTSQNLNRTPKVPATWLNQEIEPKRQSYQRNIKDYMLKAGKNQSEAKPAVDTLINPKTSLNQSPKTQEPIDSISISDDDYLP